MKGELLLEGDDGGDVRNRDGAPATADVGEEG
jgi:hypothetical protein